MNSRVLSLHHLVKAVILLGFAVYIAYLVKTDLILLYIAPRMVGYVKWSAIAFYAVAAYQLYRGIKAFRGPAAASCDCGHDHLPSRSLFKNAIIYGLFAFPLLIGFLLPDTTLGSSLAAKKGMNLSSSSSVKKDGLALDSASGAESSEADSGETKTEDPGPGDSGTVSGTAASENEMFPSDKFTEQYANYAKKLYQEELIQVREEFFIETLTSVDLYLDRFIGKKLEMTGFVYRQEEMKNNQFVVGRFSIQCCSADAAPFGVLAEYDRAAALADDSWVTVTGTIGKTTFNDIEIMVLKVEKVAKAEPSKNPYVYPNFDFGA
ncbi:TIGR03943 family putative permease subunit [Paenibacillus naphthalenovorans]|uniref:TIGR03943 family putative permease subunit n=1 Tax=Paenibacillus naphthalenovorans TaxID=162209 RepID=UPI00088DF4BE|nr:TIGR03943 family protein [Paenibacillus naphthalenovorans]GCL73080.1 TIGR03943 family protein [Paenibacillus naphthalenovorans]SDI68236.1 TIGR03943 family protein [Paenibacillus naphthalenovorans]